MFAKVVDKLTFLSYNNYRTFVLNNSINIRVYSCYINFFLIIVFIRFYIYLVAFFDICLILFYKKRLRVVVFFL